MSVRIGISTSGYMWSTPWRTCMRRLVALGYRDFELAVNPPHLALDTLSDVDLRAAASQLHQLGIKVRSVRLPDPKVNLASPLATSREHAVSLYRRVVDLAADLGATHVVTSPGHIDPKIAVPVQAQLASLRQSITELSEHARACAVGLAIENVPFTPLPDIASLCAFIRSVSSPALSISYDVANAHYIGEPPGAGLRKAAELVSLVHLSDTTRDAWVHAEIGTGDLAFGEVADALEDMDFDGICMLGIVASDPDEAIVRSHRLLATDGFERLKGFRAISGTARSSPAECRSPDTCPECKSVLH